MGTSAVYIPRTDAGDPPGRPRTPGHVFTFLWSSFAVALTHPQGMWQPWALSYLENDLKAQKTQVGLFVLIASIPSLLTLLWAYLTDAVAILGSRREGHLVLASLLAATGWAAVVFLPIGHGSLAMVGLALGAAASIAGTATRGALVEIGQRKDATGRLGAASIGLGTAAGLLAGVLYDFLSARSIGWSAATGALVWVSVALLACLLSKRGGRAPPVTVSEHRVRLGDFVRSRAFWGVLLVSTCASLPVLIRTPRAMHLKQTLRLGDARLWELDMASRSAALLGAALYLFACRRFPLARLLPACLLAQMGGTAALIALQDNRLGPIVTAAAAFGDALASVAVLDLAMRAAPRGREAFGLVLLMAGATLATMVLTALGITGYLRLGWTPLVLVAAAAGGIGVTSVLVLPRPLVAARDGTLRA